MLALELTLFPVGVASAASVATLVVALVVLETAPLASVRAGSALKGCVRELMSVDSVHLCECLIREQGLGVAHGCVPE